MTHDPATVFNRQILNSICILVRQNGGEIHGSWPVIAATLSHDMGLGDDDDDGRMQRHLLAVGMAHIVEGSGVVFFKGMDGSVHLVDRSLCDVE